MDNKELIEAMLKDADHVNAMLLKYGDDTAAPPDTLTEIENALTKLINHYLYEGFRAGYRAGYDAGAKER